METNRYLAPPASKGKTTCWGKLHLDARGRVLSWLPLAFHCLDVAIVLQHLVQLPQYRQRLEKTAGCRLDESHINRLAVIALLHDFGKCNRGFQAKVHPDTGATAGHVFEAAGFLLEWQGLWPSAWHDLIVDIVGWFKSEEQAVQMLLASISHHGRPVSLSDIEYFLSSTKAKSACEFWRAADGYDPQAALVDLVQTARAAFPLAFSKDVEPIDAKASLQHRFAGLLMLADWIASDTKFFPYATPTHQSRLEFAQQAASSALQAIGLIPPESRGTKPFAEIFGFLPNALQDALARDLTPGDDTRLLLIESDTGSGKTEAALAWFFRLYAEGRVDGLYFALPTRVAARELYGRVLRAIEAAFDPDHRPTPVLLAAPGYVKVDGQTVEHVLANPQGALWDDNDSDLRRERLWAAERPKRFLAAPIAVGTVDQALLSVLQVKHSLMRSVCLDRHLLVVDEVHASDPYMREVLRELLRGHLARGGWALLLSATLGESAAALLFDRDAVPLDQALARPYPLMSVRSSTWPVPSSRERCIQVELAPTLTDDEALLPALIRALESGARVLVICNTVARANALFRRVEAALQAEYPHLLSALFGLEGVRCPHHGRFAREDRERLDAAVTAQLGKGSPAGARLLIGTQTLEQSLDIDADWLVTDLAPMDVLIQRIGRLHRHKRENRPSGYDVPQVLVRVPPRELANYLGQKGEFTGPAGLGSVYADGRVLECTWAELKRRATLKLPQQARELIERTTHPEAQASLGKVWHAYGHKLIGKVQAEMRAATSSVLDDQPFGDLHYADKSESVLTRIGHPTYDIPLEVPMPSPFGVDIHRVAIPSHWLEKGQVPEFLRAEPTESGFRFSIDKTSFRYTRFGLEKDDA